MTRIDGGTRAERLQSDYDSLWRKYRDAQRQRDAALAWAALWKRAAIAKRRYCTVKWKLLRTTAWASSRRYGR